MESCVGCGAELLDVVVQCARQYGLDHRCECGYLETFGRKYRNRRMRPLNVPAESARWHDAGEPLRTYGGPPSPSYNKVNEMCAGCPAGQLVEIGRVRLCKQSGAVLSGPIGMPITRVPTLMATAGCPLGFWGPRRILWLAKSGETRSGGRGDRPKSKVIRWDVTESTGLEELQEAIADTAPAVVCAKAGTISPAIWARLRAQNRHTRFILMGRRTTQRRSVRPHCGPLAEPVTFGITHYLRPEYLAKCVASIERYYPGATIDVQDTGGNVSRGRNQLVSRCQTPWFVLLEEDMELTEYTDVELLRRIVAHDHELAGCGGWLRERGQWASWRHDYDVLRGQSALRPSRQPARVTPAGDVYFPCEAIHNFGLFRTVALRQVRWDEELPLGEHMEYFWRLRHDWRVAISHDVTILHAMARPSPEYIRERGRDGGFKTLALRKMGLVSQTVAAIRERAWSRPNIVVMGVGHSNTTITTRQIAALGWQLGDADAEYAESVSVRELCWRMHYDREAVDARELIAAIRRLPAPWVLKAPTFAGVLHRWLPAFVTNPPVLIWLQKDLDRVAASYVSRGESPVNVRDKWEQCEAQFQNWPWEKLIVRAEDIAAAAAMFDVDRSGGEVANA